MNTLISSCDGFLIAAGLAHALRNFNLDSYAAASCKPMGKAACKESDSVTNEPAIANWVVFSVPCSRHSEAGRRRIADAGFYHQQLQDRGGRDRSAK